MGLYQGGYPICEYVLDAATKETCQKPAVGDVMWLTLCQEHSKKVKELFERVMVYSNPSA